MGGTPRKPFIDALAVVKNAPLSGNSKGYGFVALDDEYGGHDVYCPAPVVAASAMTGGDIGAACRVKYMRINNRYVAARVTVLRETANVGDQAIADALVRLDAYVDSICDEMDTLYEMLAERGCTFPDDDVEDGHDSSL